jgi:hypothetical protein
LPETGERTEPDLELVRVSVRDDGAYGVLLARHPLGQPGVPIAVSLERTYPLPDAPHSSQLLKIPAGRHRCVRSYFFGGRYESFEILVFGHDRLLFHVANVEGELDGCVAVGRRFGVLSGKNAVLESREGFQDFMLWAGQRHAFDLRVSHAA